MSPEATSSRPFDPVVASPLDRATWLLADRADAGVVAVHFGQERAAQLLQRLEMQIRDLLVFTGGQWLDTPDGLLAHFSRPVQAVEFALRYQQALRDFSSVKGFTLTSRIAIHASDSAKDRDRSRLGNGRPTIAVTGKAAAARLLSLALPGQILLNVLAFRLSQGAKATLAERGARLQWVSHGSYCFVASMLTLSVHEVGESFLAPLSPPLTTAQVRRQAPFWRHPAIIAATVTGVLAFGLFNYFMREQIAPALDFHARDWLVVEV